MPLCVGNRKTREEFEWRGKEGKNYRRVLEGGILPAFQNVQARRSCWEEQASWRVHLGGQVAALQNVQPRHNWRQNHGRAPSRRDIGRLPERMSPPFLKERRCGELIGRAISRRPEGTSPPASGRHGGLLGWQQAAVTRSPHPPNDLKRCHFEGF